jgi:hypothetical protein
MPTAITDTELDQLAVTTIRTLSMDAVQPAHAGHPGTPMPSRFWPMTWLLIRVTWVLILIRLAEIAVWAFFYLWVEVLPDAEAAFYFSGVTYATVGYGDVVLQEPWRMLGPVEGLTGILMCGLSTGFFFALLSKVLVANARSVPIGDAGN